MNELLIKVFSFLLICLFFQLFKILNDLLEAIFRRFRLSYFNLVLNLFVNGRFIVDYSKLWRYFCIFFPYEVIKLFELFSLKMSSFIVIVV